MSTHGIGYNHHTKGEMVECAWAGCRVVIEKWPKIRRFCPLHSVANRRKKSREYKRRKPVERVAERSEK